MIGEVCRFPSSRAEFSLTHGGVEEKGLVFVWYRS